MIQVGIIPAKLVVTIAKGMPARKNCIFFDLKKKGEEKWQTKEQSPLCLSTQIV